MDIFIVSGNFDDVTIHDQEEGIWRKVKETDGDRIEKFDREQFDKWLDNEPSFNGLRVTRIYRYDDIED